MSSLRCCSTVKLVLSASDPKNVGFNDSYVVLGQYFLLEFSQLFKNKGATIWLTSVHSTYHLGQTSVLTITTRSFFFPFWIQANLTHNLRDEE